MGTDGEQTSDVLVPIEQDAIPFYGHELVAVRLEDGQIATVLRWLCESLSLNIRSQLAHIRGRRALAEGLLSVRVETEGGPQTMQALTLRVLPGWLFSVDERRVKEEAREDLVLFQRECVDVLAEHFARKHPVALPAPQGMVPADPRTAAQVAALAEQIEAQQGILTLMREHLAALMSLPGQVEHLSEQVGHVTAVVEALAERQSTTEDQVAKLDARTDHLTREHAQNAQSMVDQMVRETKRMPVPLTHAIIYGRIRRHFHANSYTVIPDTRYEELMTWLRDELARATRDEAPQQDRLF